MRVPHTTGFPECLCELLRISEIRSIKYSQSPRVEDLALGGRFGFHNLDPG